jgi:hypothetical protein
VLFGCEDLLDLEEEQGKGNRKLTGVEGRDGTYLFEVF